MRPINIVPPVGRKPPADRVLPQIATKPQSAPATNSKATTLKGAKKQPFQAKHRGAQAVTSAAPGQEPKLLDQVSQVLRTKHYSIRTEKAYIDWIYRFIIFHNKRHPREMGAPEISQFLTHLAVEKHVAPSTQNQAHAALQFLYKEVLKIDLGPVSFPWVKNLNICPSF